MFPKNQRFGYFSAFLISLIILPFLYAVFFIFPEGDDFAPALKARHLFDIIGGIDHMFSAWWKWSGRFSFHFIWVFIGYISHYRFLYALYLIMCQGILWLSIYGISKELGPKDSNGQAAFMATVCLAATLCTHGYLYGWYLLIEVQTLTAGHFLTLLYIWSLCRLWHRPTLTRANKWFAILSAVFAIGSYEHSALLVLGISCAAYILAFLYKHPHSKTFLLLVKISVVCFFISYLARGNFRRSAKKNFSTDIAHEQLMRAGSDWWFYIGQKFANPLYAIIPIIIGWFTPQWKTPLHTKIHPLIILGLGLLSILGYTFALTIVHALSPIPVGDSSKIPAHIVQYSAIIVFFCLLACREPLRLDKIRLLGKPFTLVLLFGLLLGGQSNFFPVLWNDMSGAYARYESAYEKRKTIIAQHPNEILEVMPLEPAPFPITVILYQNRKDWPNKYAAPFYGLAGIEAKAVDAATIYKKALDEGAISWHPANDHMAVSLVPSFTAGENIIYRFDSIFIKTQLPTPPTIRLYAWNTTPPFFDYIKKEIVTASGIFSTASTVYTLNPFTSPDGEILYALPLPQIDSGANPLAFYGFKTEDSALFLFNDMATDKR